MKKEKKESTILGIITIGGGASWYQSDDEIKCAFKCAKICKSDWKHLFKFEKKHQFPVNLFDLTKAKKGVFFKNKKIANNAEDLFTKMLGGK